MKQTLVLGGPGCGKTTKLLEILDEIFSSGIKPHEVAFLTFTRRAAGEAIERSCKKFDFEPDQLPWFRTLHSYAFRALGIASKELMTNEHYRVLENVLGIKFDVEMSENAIFCDQSKWGRALALEQLARGTQRPLSAVCEDHFFKEREAQFVADGLANYKQAHKLLDFTDLLERYADGDGETLHHKVVFVDEAQDLSALQWRCVERITRGASHLYIAGDDDQAIFSWAGADVDHFLALGGEKIVLPVSHRLPRNIWQVAQNVASMIGARFPKEWEPRAEGGIVERVNGLEHLNLDTGSWMILARTRSQLRLARKHMRRHGLPYTLDGRSSVNNPDVRAILAWEELRRGGEVEATAAKALWLRVSSDHKTPANVLGIAKEGVYTFDRLVAENGLQAASRDADWMSALSLRRADVEYYREIKKRGESLVDEPRLTLATIHTVKGGEADNVALFFDMGPMAFADFKRNPDNELRVLYVAVSRAREALWCIYPTTLHGYPIKGVIV